MSASLEEITQKREKGPLRQMVRSQPFWVTIALALICVAKGYRLHIVTSDAFSQDKLRLALPRFSGQGERIELWLWREEGRSVAGVARELGNGTSL